MALLLHDADLKRTTNGQGRAADLDWQELAKLDAGGWHSEAFRGEPLPTFEAVAQLLRSQDTMANVEIKPTPGFDRLTGERVSLEAQRLWSDAAVPPLLSSFSYEALMAAKDAAPSLPRGWLTKEFGPDDWARLNSLEAVSLHTDHRRFDASLLAQLKQQGFRVFLYTINDASTAERWLDAGVDGIFTDNLADFAKRFPTLI